MTAGRRPRGRPRTASVIYDGPPADDEPAPVVSSIPRVKLLIARFIEAEALADFDDSAIRAVSRDLGTEALTLSRQTPLRPSLAVNRARVAAERDPSGRGATS